MRDYFSTVMQTGSWHYIDVELEFNYFFDRYWNGAGINM